MGVQGEALSSRPMAIADPDPEDGVDLCLGLHLAENTPAGGILRHHTRHCWRVMSDLAFKIPVHELCVAIGAFDKPGVVRDGKPDAWMTKRALAAVTGDAVTVDDPGFGGLCHHPAFPFVLNSTRSDYEG